MIKKLSIATFLLVLLCLTMVGRAWAQIRVPGVVQGNTFTYDVTAFWSSDDPSATIPAYLLEMNNTEYYRVTITAVAITGVSGAEITTQNVWHFKNGTETSTTGTINLETGISTGGFWAIVAGNLGVNDLLHPSGQNKITVNETVMRDYAGVERETNHLMLMFLRSDDGNSVEHVDYYFDKQTGMLVQLNDVTSYTNPRKTVTIFWKIKDSNVWVVPEFPSVLILPLFMIATLLAVIAYKKTHASIMKTLVPAKIHKF